MNNNALTRQTSRKNTIQLIKFSLSKYLSSMYTNKIKIKIEFSFLFTKTLAVLVYQTSKIKTVVWWLY